MPYTDEGIWYRAEAETPTARELCKKEIKQLLDDAVDQLERECLMEGASPDEARIAHHHRHRFRAESKIGGPEVTLLDSIGARRHLGEGLPALARQIVRGARLKAKYGDDPADTLVERLVAGGVSKGRAAAYRDRAWREDDGTVGVQLDDGAAAAHGDAAFDTLVRLIVSDEESRERQEHIRTEIAENPLEALSGMSLGVDYSL